MSDDNLIKPVDIPRNTGTWLCERCQHDHCLDCVSKHEVDFDATENVEERPGFAARLHNWKGTEVCPWCYNQLLKKLGETDERSDTQE